MKFALFSILLFTFSSAHALVVTCNFGFEGKSLNLVFDVESPEKIVAGLGNMRGNLKASPSSADVFTGQEISHLRVSGVGENRAKVQWFRTQDGLPKAMVNGTFGINFEDDKDNSSKFFSFEITGILESNSHFIEPDTEFTGKASVVSSYQEVNSDGEQTLSFGRGAYVDLTCSNFTDLDFDKIKID